MRGVAGSNFGRRGLAHLRSTSELRPHPMARVAAWIFHQIVLMIILANGEGSRWYHRGDHRRGPPTAAIYTFDDLGRYLGLSFTGGKNCRAILGTNVVTLLIACGGIVHPKKPMLQQISKAKPGWIKHNTHRFRMA